MTGNRVHALDALRGLAILCVVLLHRYFYDWAGATSGPAVTVGSLLLSIFLVMAGIFYVISGSVNVYQVYTKLVAGKRDLRASALRAIVKAAWVMGLHFLHKWLLAPGFYINHAPQYGLVVGALREGTWLHPLAANFLVTGTLMLVSFILLCNTGVAVLLFRKGGYERLRRNYRVLAGIGCTILVATPFLQYWLLPCLYALTDEGRYGLALLLAILVGPDLPLFPFLGFGFFGAVLGLALATHETPRWIKRNVARAGLLWYGLGMTGYVLSGILFPGMAGSARLFVEALNNAFLRYLQLGLFFFFTILFLMALDFVDEATKARRAKRAGFLIRAGKCSLTIFFLETLVAELLRPLYEAFLPAWTESLGWVVLFGLVNILVWVLVTALWDRVDFVGSLDWVTGKVANVVRRDPPGLPKPLTLEDDSLERL